MTIARRFSSFQFSFQGNYTVVATNGSDTYQGIWGVFSDDYDDDDDELEFFITFASSSILQQLNDDDWEIRQRTNTKIRLQEDDDNDDVLIIREDLKIKAGYMPAFLVLLLM